jgi:hypothetical protein
MKSLLLSLVTVATLLLGSAIGQSPRLGVELRTDKTSYKLKDVVSFEILLTNKSRAPIYLYSDLEWGESASVSIWLKDAASGKDVGYVVIPDAVTPPPTSKEDFVKVLPDHVYGLVIASSVHDLNVRKKGAYQVVAYYHSPIPQSYSFDLPIWSHEDGMLRSNTVRVTIGD